MNFEVFLDVDDQSFSGDRLAVAIHDWQFECSRKLHKVVLAHG
jgi:hypothetical protein